MIYIQKNLQRNSKFKFWISSEQHVKVWFISFFSPSSVENDSCQLSSRKKRRGVIEKKRRDRINSSLSELKRLVPSAFEKQGSAKLEKAEILQLTVDHLKTLHSKGELCFLSLFFIFFAAADFYLKITEPFYEVLWLQSRDEHNIHELKLSKNIIQVKNQNVLHQLMVLQDHISHVVEITFPR